MHPQEEPSPLRRSQPISSHPPESVKNATTRPGRAPTPYTTSLSPEEGGRVETNAKPLEKLSVDGDQTASAPFALGSLWSTLLQHRWFSWISKKWTWPNWKIAIRCSVAAWLGLVILLIVPSERAIGYAAFFMLVVAFMVPPNQPVVQSLEIFINLFAFSGIAWAWSCLGIFIADQVRTPTDPAAIAAAQAKWASLQDDSTIYEIRIVFDGTYIQAGPAIVCAVFLAIGTGALLWYKLRTQPSPATFPLVLACVLVDVTLTTAHFYPDARYNTGLLFFEPMAVQAGLATLAALFIFPESVGHSFQGKFTIILTPLVSAMGAIESLFLVNADPDAKHGAAVSLEVWAEKGKTIRTQLLSSLGGLPPLRAQQRYLSVDFSYSRLSGHDLRELFDRLLVVQTRSGGLAFFFDVTSANLRHTHLDSSAFSVRQVSESRPVSRPSSRPASLRGSSEQATAGELSIPGHETQKRLHLSFLDRPTSHGHRGSHISLYEHLRKSQQPVGVYESQRYMDVENSFSDDSVHTLEQMGILALAGLPLVRECRAALALANSWIITVNSDRHLFYQKQHIVQVEEATRALQNALDDFRIERLAAVKPYRHIFEPNLAVEDDHKPQFRGLFQNFVAQYHLIEFSESLLKLLRTMEDLDSSRTRRRFWYPKPWTLLRHLKSSHEERHLTDGAEEGENDPAFNPLVDDVLGEVKKRNPEYTSFESPTFVLLSRIASLSEILKSKSLMYAVKAAVLGALTTLPVFLLSSGSFYYYNRGVWCTIISGLSSVRSCSLDDLGMSRLVGLSGAHNIIALAVYSGDTTSAWVGRVVASFWGSLFGMAAWYIGAGSGQGNPYGLAVVGAVTIPVATFFRVHFPGQVLTAVMTPVTYGLVIGYSYLNATLGQLTDAGVGWSVAWRRFLCVVIGITSAWLFSFFPPSYSAKRAIRYSYAQTIAATGSIFCDILSAANDHHVRVEESIEIRQKLLHWRAKLNKLGVRHANATYEYSLKGRWPEERYKAMLDTLEDALSLLAQLNHVLSQLERPWRKALLDRTRLSELLFLGDILAVISLCSTSLRSGTPLPQITPSPLVARYRLGKTRGMDLPSDPTDQAGEIPSHVTVEVLESENYMRYALGITTIYSLLARMDRLTVICKTLLGESYHISGLHMEEQV